MGNASRFTLTQAAAVTGLPLAAVHKAVENGFVRPYRNGKTRLVSKEQLLFLQLEAGGLRALPVSNRREVARLLRSRPNADVLPLTHNDVLRIEVRQARRRLDRSLRQWNNVAKHVVSDPEILRGTPVFRGTRIPVHAIADMLRHGATIEELAEGYPALTRNLIVLAPLYARALPRRGRPRARRSHNRESEPPIPAG